MTEAEWDTCTDPIPMVEFMRGKVSDRKRRLFAVACCGRMQHHFEDPGCRLAVEVAERYADGLADNTELLQAHKSAVRAYNRIHSDILQVPVFVTRTRLDFDEAVGLEDYVALVSSILLDGVEYPRKTVEQAAQVNLLRHLIGDPFRACQAAASWPSQVIHLASAVYEGQDCSFALHDALLEAGHPELAKHFTDEQSHPKGCFAVDLILGKK